MFAGDHALGGERHGQEAVREWFREMLRLFPGIQIVPREVVVNGWPWNTVVATHLAISATRPDGRAYRNEGMQLLRLRWGRVVEDLIFEDTLKLDAELRRASMRRARAAAVRDESLRRVMRWLGHRRWFAAAGRRFGAPLDRFLYRVTRGRSRPRPASRR